MDLFDILLAGVAIVLVAMATAWRDLGERARRLLRAVGLFVVFVIYCLLAAGLAAYGVRAMPLTAPRAIAAMCLVVGWGGWGLTWLVRHGPRWRVPPPPVARPFGLAGLACLVLAGAGFVALFAAP